MSETSSTITINGIHSNAGNLAHLIAETVVVILEMDHSNLTETQKQIVNRACALTSIARDVAEKLDDDIGETIRGNDITPKGERHEV